VPVIEETESYGYYREEGGGLLVGMFEPVGRAWGLDGTPRDSAFAVLPPDWDRLAPFLEVAMRRFPALEDAGIRTLFCGPESFTDDLSPMLGESPEVDDLYLACGLNSVGILSAGGLGHMMAQWLIEGHPPLDVTTVGVDRTHEFQATRLFRQERTVERLGFLLNDMSWPNAQPRLGRDVRRSPYHARHVADGACFVATSGWEYPDWFAGPGVIPTVEWGFARGEAFERTREEHLHARDAFAIFDLSLMSHHLVQGPGAVAVLNRVCANDVDTPPGRIVYTQWLHERGGIIADVTVTRLAEDAYVVISGDNIHRRVPAWIRRQTRSGEFVTVTDVTGAHALLSVQGPRSRELLQRVSPDDWSDDAFPYLSAQKVELGYTPLWALRVTYVGELGWDLLVPTEFGATLYEQLREAAADLGFRPTGLGALETMRLEKAFRDMGHDIDSTDTPLEAGLGFAVAWDKPGGFVGREALLKQRESGPPTRRLVNVMLTSPDFDLYGDEPVYWDGRPVGHVRSGGFGHSLGAACGIAGIGREEGFTGADLATGSFEIDVAGTRVPARVSLKPFFDPERSRILC
jgi:glycine cleavage system aminomethyltransferase T